MLAEAEGSAPASISGPATPKRLPFADASFDCIFSVTVLEECDAGKAIAEMVRVARPGGRIGVVVRAIDLPQWWNPTCPSRSAARSLRRRNRSGRMASPMRAFTGG